METCCAEMTQNKQIIAATINKDRKWSRKKMEGDEGFNTVECLRGRLLAERQASRLAKEQAESMGDLLFELEKKLREEIKLRDKAERRLKFFSKKLESFNINNSSMSGESEQSEKCENSITSSTRSSTSRDPESNETKPYITNAAVSENSAALIAEDSDSEGTYHSSSSSNPSSGDMKHDKSRLSSSSTKSSAGDSNSHVTDDSCSDLNPNHSFSQNHCHNPNLSAEGLKNEGHRVLSSGSKSSATDNESDDRELFDNSLALVPVDLATTTQANDPKPVDQSVIQVLDALRHAREKLLGSMGTRHIIKV